MDDRRSHPRIDFSGRTVVFIGDQQVVCKGSNLSAGGMLLLAPLAAPLGQTLKLALSLQPSQWVNLEARVVRHAQESGAIAWGLEFVRVSSELAAMLAGYVAGRLGVADGGAPAPAPTRSSSAAAARATSPRAPTGPAHPAVPPRKKGDPTAPARPAAPRTPTSPGQPKVTVKPPEPEGGGLFSRLKNRISAAWTGGEPAPAPEKKQQPAATPATTSYALGRGAKPSAQVNPVGPARGKPGKAGAKQKDAPLEDVPPAGEVEDVPEDVLPHDDILGDADKILHGKDRKLHQLYSAALRDVQTEPGRDPIKKKRS
jgi:hypothetical protein